VVSLVLLFIPLSRRIFSSTHYIFFPAFLAIFCLVAVNIYAQTPLKTFSDSSDSLKSVEGEHVSKFYVLPFATVSPETSVQIGASPIYLFRKEGVAPETQLSSLRLPLSYTLNNQFKAKFEADYYSDQNAHLVSFVAEWLNFPLLFWGLGNNTQDADEELYTTQLFNTELGYLKSLGSGFFLGLGYRYINSEITEVQAGGILEQPGLIPGNNGTIVSGFIFNFRFDNRDNYLNAASGFYADVKLASYEPWLGSNFDFTRLDLDLRKYFKPFNKHVLAFQALLVNIWGDPSFETMALLGGKMIMRGHYEGRFRDNSLYAAQAEYRIPLVRANWIDTRDKVPFRERWGLVVFLGAGDVASSYGDINFREIKPSYGFGIRYLAIPKERINLSLDFGFGTQFPGIYFNIREAF